MDVIQASIPLFFLLIGLELVVARARRQQVYRLSDSISDLSCGILSQLSGIFVALATIGLFGWIQSRFAIQHWLAVPGWLDRPPFPHGSGPFGLGIDGLALASWAGVFLLDDLAYYWTHRFSHEVNLLWAGHVVHHSSEEYNLTVALRQSSLHGLFTWVFYLPLALLGVPVTMWVVCHGLNLIYQFWIHTREVNRLPRGVEAVLNTPSHHRVHHGVNPEYQDKNYAGVFIVWDRLFGTFEPEVATPVYGITHPLASWNPVWANLHVFADIGHELRRATRGRDKLRVVFGHPGWKPSEPDPSERPRAVSVDSFTKYDPPVPRGLKAYALIQFAVALVASVVLLSSAATLPVGQTLAGVFYLALTLSNVGAVLEGRGWAAVSEVVRLAVLGLAALTLAVMGRGDPPLLAGLALFALASLAWVVSLRRAFSPSSPSVRTA